MRVELRRKHVIETHHIILLSKECVSKYAMVPRSLVSDQIQSTRAGETPRNANADKGKGRGGRESDDDPDRSR